MALYRRAAAAPSTERRDVAPDVFAGARCRSVLPWATVIRAVSKRLLSKRFHIIVMTPTRCFRPEIPSPPCHASGHCRYNCRHMVCAGEGTPSMVAPDGR